MLQFFKFIFTGPTSQKDHLTVSFYLTGGQIVQTHHVKLIETKKTAEGGFGSYKIVWHAGFEPKYFSLTLDHISAITVLEA